MRSAALLPLLLAAASLAPASAHPDGFEYHAHQAFVRNGTAVRKRATTAASCPSTSNLIGSYVPTWTTGAVQAVDWTKTDLAFYFCALTGTAGIELASGMTASGMTAFTAAAKAAGKKPLLTVGGWSGSVYFSSLVATSSARTTFANSILSYMTTYGFGGVDLDWEFVGRQGAGNNIVSTSDAANYLLFLKTLRTTIGTGYLITGAVPAAGFTGADGAILTDVSGFALYFDYLTLMAYDYYGSWSSSTGPNAALNTCNSGSDSAAATIARWKGWGFPACRLLLGIPSYSHSFVTTSSTLASTTYGSTTGINAFQTVGTGTNPVTDGALVSELIAGGYLTSDLSAGANGYTRYFDTCTSTPFLFNPSTKSFIAYDDAQSWKAKAAYAKANGLAGVAIYESTGGTASMLAAAAAGLTSSSSSTTTTTAPSSTTSAAKTTTTTAAAAAATVACTTTTDCTSGKYLAPANSVAKCNKARGYCVPCALQHRLHSERVIVRCVRRGADDYDQGDYDDNLEDYDDNLTDHHDHFENDDNVGCEGYSYVLRRYYRLQCSGLHHSHLLSLQYSCSSKKCTFACNTGYTKSGSSCIKTVTTTSSNVVLVQVATTTTSAAAAASQTCSASNNCTGTIPVNSNHYCKSKVCTYRCRTGYTASGSSCVASSARRFMRSKRTSDANLDTLLDEDESWAEQALHFDALLD